MAKKIPLVQYLVDYHFENERAAQQAVKLGIVSLNGKTVKRPGISISPMRPSEASPSESIGDKIHVVGGGKIFVSRGGYKIQKALETFSVNPHNRVCLDVGASTGGFTDCLLKYGAKYVYSVDTGYGQLDWSLRTSEQVRCIERTNIRYLQPDKLYQGQTDLHKQKADLITVDVSFISVIKIIPALQSLCAGQEKTDFLFLIKPQFEADKGTVGRGGVIRNPILHQEILERFIQSCFRAGLDLKGLTFSPLCGAEGNVEFLGHFIWPERGRSINVHLPDLIRKTVENAYRL